MQNEISGHERLDSWKDIAAYLGRNVRTVIRWEKEKALPVRRVPGGQRQAVFAYKYELDAWLAQSLTTAAQTESISRKNAARFKQTRRSTLNWFLRIAAILGVAGILAGMMFARKGGTDALQIKGFGQLTHDRTSKSQLIRSGDRLYFSEEIGGRFVVSSISESGGEIERVPVALANVFPYDISRNGNELLVTSFDGIEFEQPLWTVSTHGGEAHRIGSVRCQRAAWSHTDDIIAYASGNEIYLTRDRGKSIQRVAAFGAAPQLLRWSPDGKQLRFVLVSASGTESAAWEITFGKDYQIISTRRMDIEADCCAAWAWAEPRTFFYSEMREADVLVREEERPWWAFRIKPTHLSTRLPRIDGLATDAEQRKLFVLSDGGMKGELLAFNQGSREFTPYAPGISAMYVDLAKDGKRLTYTNVEDDTLWVSRADGTERKQLTFAPMRVMLPRWSPDGTMIAFTARLPDRPWRIVTISANGGAPKEVSSGTENQGAPTWAPDARSIVYADILCAANRSCAVHRIDLGTGVVSTIPGSEGLRTARLSPNGKYIAALQPERHELLVWNLRALSWQKLVSDATGDDISWSPDSRLIYASRPMGTKAEIVRVSVDTGREDAVLDLKLMNRLATGRVGPFFALAPDHSVILTRFFDSSELYEVDWKSR